MTSRMVQEALQGFSAGILTLEEARGVLLKELDILAVKHAAEESPAECAEENSAA